VLPSAWADAPGSTKPWAIAARASAHVTIPHRGPRPLGRFDPDLVDQSVQGEWLARQWRERSGSTSRTQANNPGSSDEEAGHCQKTVTFPNIL